MKKGFRLSPIALKIATIYAIFGLLWILLSDKLLIFLVRDTNTVNQVQTFKGWFYVLATAALVYFLVEKYIKSIQSSENKFKRLLKNIADPIFLADSKGRIIDANEAAITSLGYTRNELLKLTLSEIDSETDLDVWINSISVMPTDHQFAIDTNHTRKDGSTFPVEVSACVFDEGNSRYCLGVARDITERIQTQQLLVQHEKMNSLGSMAAGIAHEINNPLSAILGACQNIHNRIYKDTPKNLQVAAECNANLDRLRDYITKRKIDRMINSISEAGNRASKIVTSMLNFSYSKTRKMHTCKMSSLLNESIDLISADFNLKKDYDFKLIKITREYSKETMPVCCVPNEIQQVFLNLFKNATEAMAEKDYPPNEKPELKLRVINTADNVLIEVEDNGPGINGESQKKIFDPFYTSKDVGKGTGLGLSVSYFIITKQHKGSMEVSSTLGKGTKFTVTLPQKICESCKID